VSDSSSSTKSKVKNWNPEQILLCCPSILSIFVPWVW
jgi:hypothetical protein